MTNTDIFPVCEKIVKTHDKQYVVTYVSNGFILDVIILMIWTMNILKVMMKLGAVKLVFRKFYHSAIRRSIQTKLT